MFKSRYICIINKYLSMVDNEKFTAGNYSQSPTCKTCDKTLNGTNDHSKCSGEVYYKEMESKISNAESNPEASTKKSSIKKYIIIAVAVIALAAVGYFGYNFFFTGTDSTDTENASGDQPPIVTSPFEDEKSPLPTEINTDETSEVSEVIEELEEAVSDDSDAPPGLTTTPPVEPIEEPIEEPEPTEPTEPAKVGR